MARPADPNARGALIAAARRELARKGLRGARIEDITSACGLSKGAFYLHFRSKEELFGQLVAQLVEQLEVQAAGRLPKLEAFFAAEGTLTAEDVARNTERHQRLMALEIDEDTRTLELLWEMRDVVDVLLTGSRGTPFEGLVWEMADREVKRVAESFAKLQGQSACRSDVPPHIFGSLIVGTYLLVAKQMARWPAKPDLRAWTMAIHRLVREGSSPRPGQLEQAPQRLPAAPAPSRAARPSRRSRVPRRKK